LTKAGIPSGKVLDELLQNMRLLLYKDMAEKKELASAQRKAKKAKNSGDGHGTPDVGEGGNEADENVAPANNGVILLPEFTPSSNQREDNTDYDVLMSLLPPASRGAVGDNASFLEEAPAQTADLLLEKITSSNSVTELLGLETPLLISNATQGAGDSTPCAGKSSGVTVVFDVLQM
jgi:hypothetical protein